MYVNLLGKYTYLQVFDDEVSKFRAIWVYITTRIDIAETTTQVIQAKKVGNQPSIW
jgi:hypothetical protein